MKPNHSDQSSKSTLKRSKPAARAVISLLSDDDSPPKPPRLSKGPTQLNQKTISEKIIPRKRIRVEDGMDFAKSLSKAAYKTNSPVSNHVPTPPPAVPTPDATKALPAEPEPLLCEEQINLVNLILSGVNVYLDGSGGVGKSTAIKAATKKLEKIGRKVYTVTPTGVSALAINGQTTWTFAGLNPNDNKKNIDEIRKLAHRKTVQRRLKNTHVLVIDEISMVEKFHFERLNAVMKEARFSEAPFGNVQVIVTGDFFQLPPVKAFGNCVECGGELTLQKMAGTTTYKCPRHGGFLEEEKWAFHSKAWKECKFVNVQLTKIHRQSDEVFINMLQKCRKGIHLTWEENELLLNHECRVHHATRLFALRHEAAKFNLENFRRLTGEEHHYWCRDTFICRNDFLRSKDRRYMPDENMSLSQKPPGCDLPLEALKDHRWEYQIKLKKGMLVVLLANLDLQAGLCNGSQGIICGWEDYDEKKLPKLGGKGDTEEMKAYNARAAMREDEVLEFSRANGLGYKKWPIVRFHNGQQITVYADCTINEIGDQKPYSLLCRTQIPLAPAWAMTIHKSQSLTLDRVRVDPSSVFEDGQLYVALSRAKSLHGLKIDGDVLDINSKVRVNKEVLKFHQRTFSA